MTLQPRAIHRVLLLLFTLSVGLGWAREARATTFVGGPMTASTTWTLAASPYEVTSTITVTNYARLTIEAGVVVRFRKNTGLTIAHPKFDMCESTCFEVGRLSVLGTAAKPVLFTSKSGLPGDWRGLTFGPASDYTASGALISFLTVERAGQSLLPQSGPTPNISLLKTGQGFSWANVTSAGGAGDGLRLTDSALNLSLANFISNDGVGIRALRATVGITKSTISGNSLGGLAFHDVKGSVSKSQIMGNGGAGIELQDSTQNFTDEFQITITSNEIGANSSYAITFFFKNRPIITGNTLNGNGDPGILVVGGSVVVPAAFSRQIGESNFDVVNASIVLKTNNPFVIEAGCTVRFARFTGIEIGTEAGFLGALVANGTPEAPITMTSHPFTSPGSWRGLHFAPNPFGLSSLENVVIERAGQLNSGNPPPFDTIAAGVILHETGSFFTSWTNVTVRESAGHGMYLDDAEINVVGGSFSSNAATGIFAQSSILDLGGAELSNNADVGLFLFTDSTQGFVHDCIIDGNGSDGVSVFASPSVITANTITGNGAYGVRYTLNRSTQIFGNTLAGNFFPGVLGEGLTLTRDEVWSPQAGEPFLTLTDYITIASSAELRIEAGLTAMFPPGGGLGVGFVNENCAPGSPPSCVAGLYSRLTVQGSAFAPVVLTSTQGTPGSWRGITFGPVTDQGVLSRMDYTILENTGEPFSSTSPATSLGGAIALVSTTAILNNLTIAFTSGPGLVSDTSSPLVKNSVIAFTGGGALHAIGTGAPSFSFGVLHQNAPNVGWVPAASTLITDPLFVDAPAGDYTPAPGSPCIDSGTATGLPFLGAAPNRGAIE